MRHDAVAEESGNAPTCAVKELIRNNEIEWCMFLLQGTDGAKRKNSLHAEHLHAVDICPEVELRGRNLVPAAVPGQERNALAFQFPQDVGVRRRTEGGGQRDLVMRFETRHAVQP